MRMDRRPLVIGMSEQGVDGGAMKNLGGRGRDRMASLLKRTGCPLVYFSLMMFSWVVPSAFSAVPGAKPAMSVTSEQDSSTTAFVDAGVKGGSVSCGVLDQPGVRYALEGDVSSPGTCFTVSASDVVIDCQGHEIRYSADGSPGYGVSAVNVSGTVIQNCSITEGIGTAGDRHAVYFDHARDGTIENNTITTTRSPAIYLSRNCHNNVIQDNTISATILSWADGGIPSVGACTIGMSNGNLFAGNNIGNIIRHNQISAHELHIGQLFNGVAISLYHSLRAEVTDNTISVGGISIRSGSFSNRFDTNRLEDGGVTVTSGSKFNENTHNTFHAMSIHTARSNDFGLFLNNLAHENIYVTMSDSTLNAEKADDLRIWYYSPTTTTSGWADLTNVSFDAESVLMGTTPTFLIVRWYVEMTVTDILGNPIDGATIDVKTAYTGGMENTLGAQHFTEQTRSDGTLPRKTLVSYFQQGCDLPPCHPVFFTPYTVTTTKEGYETDKRTIDTLSANVVLHIVLNSEAPLITSQATSQMVEEGKHVAFTVVATGRAPLTYQWQKDGVNIDGANTSSYTIDSVSASDAGSYRVIVSNSVGDAASDVVTLTVPVAPGRTVYYVDNPGDGRGLDGDDRNTGGINDPLATIQQAADLAVAGDTVNVRAGTYLYDGTGDGVVKIKNSGEENLPIVFEAMEGEHVVIDAGGGAFGFEIQDKAHITIRDFEIQNATRAGIFLRANTSNTIDGYLIENNIIHDIRNTSSVNKGVSGIGAYNRQKDGIIRNNEIYDSSIGIVVRAEGSGGYCDDVRLEHNYVHDMVWFNDRSEYNNKNADGIVVNTCRRALIRNNVMARCGDDGLDVYKSFDALIEKNVAFNNGGGIFLSSDAPVAPGGTLGDGNGFKSSTGGGGGHIFMANVSFNNWSRGFDQDHVEPDAPGNMYYNNVAYGNGVWGLLVEKESRSPTILRNNIFYLNNDNEEGQEVRIKDVSPADSDYNFIADARWPKETLKIEGPGTAGAHSLPNVAGPISPRADPRFVAPPAPAALLDSDKPGVVVDLHDPDFGDAGGFRLQQTSGGDSSGSPLIDAGEEVSYSHPQTGEVIHVLFEGTAPDIGAYEFGSGEVSPPPLPPPPAPSPSPGLNPIAPSLSSTPSFLIKPSVNLSFSFTFDRQNPKCLGTGEAKIYDRGGRLVTTLPVQNYAVKWDGRGDSGRVASGVYHALLKCGGLIEKRSVVVLK